MELIAKIKSPVDPATIAPEGAVFVTVELFERSDSKPTLRFLIALPGYGATYPGDRRVNSGWRTVVGVLTATRPHITNHAVNVRIKVLSSVKDSLAGSGQA